MAEDSSAQNVDPSLIAEIVISYFMRNKVGVSEVAGVIVTVHRTLRGLGTDAVPAAEAVAPAVPIRRSVRRDYVVCLECGFHAQTLRRHLRVAHGLDPARYRARWNLPHDHPFSAPAYSALRSAMAKQIGLGRKSRGSVSTERSGRTQRAPAN